MGTQPPPVCPRLDQVMQLQGTRQYKYSKILKTSALPWLSLIWHQQPHWLDHSFGQSPIAEVCDQEMWLGAWPTLAGPRACAGLSTQLRWYFPFHWTMWYQVKATYLTAMSPSRAQHVLWICDVALCTYLRCSHDSKSSPHPPSVICLESRNWQAWATSLHATLQRQTIRQG